MGRPGIAFEDVASAAANLADAGNSPTVDNVRLALGGTGSKSTIAPLLKRWKAEHSALLAAPDARLPATLLQAVRNVHEQMQAAADEQVSKAEALQLAAQQAAELRVSEADARSARLEGEKALLTAQCAETVNALTGLQAQLHARALEIAALQSEAAGLQMRLADRAAEVSALNKQLAQARAQFEHYQDASLAQRNQDRQAADQRAAALEQALAMERRQSAELQAESTRQASRLVQLSETATRLEEDLRAEAATRDSLRTERDQLVFQLRESVTARHAATAAADQSATALAAANIALGAQTRQSEMLAAQLEQVRVVEERREKQGLELIHANAALLARIAVLVPDAAEARHGQRE
jgi:chromosome segregation ATPase